MNASDDAVNDVPLEDIWLELAVGDLCELLRLGNEPEVVALLREACLLSRRNRRFGIVLIAIRDQPGYGQLPVSDIDVAVQAACNGLCTEDTDGWHLTPAGDAWLKQWQTPPTLAR